MRYYRHGYEAKECMIVGLGGELELWHARQHLFDTRIFFFESLKSLYPIKPTYRMS